MYSNILSIFIVFLCTGSVFTGLPNCSHPIYCDTSPGSVLDVIQRLRLFSDQKTFVDMPLKNPVQDVLNTFRDIQMNKTTKETYINFINDNFYAKGYEIHGHSPTDFPSNPSFLDKIEDKKLKEWAKEVHKIWPVLGRKVVHTNSPDMYSSIKVPNPFVVPGGRFDGFYYWDSYFVILGLLVSEMHQTAYQMIQNFYHLVDQYGFIPNGMRVYFLSRSQPPLLTFMIDVVYERTKNITFLNESIPYLMKEYEFWMNYRSVDIKNIKGNSLNRYFTNGWGKPRPESYMEDVELTSSPEKYDHIVAAAESGLDFSSKWFERETEMSSIETTWVVPVELNAYLYHNELLLSKYNAILENITLSNFYREAAKARKETMEKYMWDKDSGQWWDVDWVTGKKRIRAKSARKDRQYITNFFPSFLGFEDKQDAVVVPVELLAYPGGVPFSLFHNKKAPQQWDFPNAWAPTSFFMIQSLEAISGYDERFEVNKWISNCYCSWKKDKAKVMYEKYDVEQLGRHGGGGEYRNQVGFGWTNGVTLYLLEKYGDTLKANSCLSYTTLVIIVSIITGILVYCICCCVGCFLCRQCYIAYRQEKKKLKEYNGEELDDSGEIGDGRTNEDEREEEETTSLLLKHQEVEDTLQGIVDGEIGREKEEEEQREVEVTLLDEMDD